MFNVTISLLETQLHDFNRTYIIKNTIPEKLTSDVTKSAKHTQDITHYSVGETHTGHYNGNDENVGNAFKKTYNNVRKK